MFYNCSKLTTDFVLDDVSSLENGMGMFEGSGITTNMFNLMSFPKLVHARQMFYKCDGMSGHLDLNMPKNFPNVRPNSYSGGSSPIARMFGECPITSINFDVSNLDNGVSMFY